MLNWLRHTASRAWGDVTGAATDMVHWAIGGIAALLNTLFGDVAGAWDDMMTAAGVLEKVTASWAESIWGKLREITGYWIPHFAYYAWWYVTHPEAFVKLLFWPLIAMLEANAEQAAQYLGEFALHLIIRQLRPLLRVAEQILAAVL